ncbi:MAG: hypothetical protein ACR2MO_14965 [Acidimicrobiales bacterium]
MARRGRSASAAVVVAVLAVAVLGAGLAALSTHSDGEDEAAGAPATGEAAPEAGTPVRAGTPAPPPTRAVASSPTSTVPPRSGALAEARSRSAGTPGTTAPGTTAAAPPGTAAPAAGPLVLRPPYADHYRASQCVGGPVGRCVADSSPDRSTGAVGVHLDVASPAGGAVPGAGAGQAYSEVVVTSRLDRPARSVLVTVEVLVRSAGVGRSLAGVPLPPLPTSAAQIYFEVGALHSLCGGAGCFIQEAQSVVELAAGPQTASQQYLALRLVLTNPAGALPAGDVSVSAGLYGYAELGTRLVGEAVPDVGSVTAKVDAVVTSITLTPTA